MAGREARAMTDEKMACPCGRVFYIPESYFNQGMTLICSCLREYRFLGKEEPQSAYRTEFTR